MNADYLSSIKKLFLYYKTLAEKSMEQLEAQQLFETVNEESNSIAIIVKHLSGNLLSRWTDFLTTDGEKPWRNRDAEFVNGGATKEELMKMWNEGCNCFLKAIEELKPEQMLDIIYIRNEGHTVVEAINRSLTHYSYHTGQIVFAAKMLKKGSWNSLSIPKNASKVYNNDKFSVEKNVKNFADEELKRLKK